MSDKVGALRICYAKCNKPVEEGTDTGFHLCEAPRVVKSQKRKKKGACQGQWEEEGRIGRTVSVLEDLKALKICFTIECTSIHLNMVRCQFKLYVFDSKRNSDLI